MPSGKTTDTRHRARTESMVTQYHGVDKSIYKDGYAGGEETASDSISPEESSKTDIVKKPLSGKCIKGLRRRSMIRGDARGLFFSFQEDTPHKVRRLIISSIYKMESSESLEKDMNDFVDQLYQKAKEYAHKSSLEKKSKPDKVSQTLTGTTGAEAAKRKSMAKL